MDRGKMDTMKRYKWIIQVRIYKMCVCVCVCARALLTREHGRLQDRCERLRLPQRKQPVRLKLKKQAAFLPPCWNYKWGWRVEGIRQQLASISYTSICLTNETTDYYYHDLVMLKLHRSRGREGKLRKGVDQSHRKLQACGASCKDDDPMWKRGVLEGEV